ncbi:putative MFS-type transporter YcnB [Pullulanibacillus camelliae]|uniref:Putative MFS-type transporter YcnB n=1 Tax=Pullulanibacillus camelliae TaxID=1707096 RepID=A0A8J2YMC2_9BACL|nr:DHA2 family efflux MFS transporter permease subunit [Pullulanibacillus camelliae]GGE52868.1 putative MFS-type transporter YcnB [Pullulanibacillus camelliae]
MTTQQQATPEFKRGLIVAVLISGAFVAILNQTLLATALPHIMKDLSLDNTTVQWLQTVFLLVNGIMIPITAFLIGSFSTRKLFLTAIALFGIGTLICAVAPNFGFLIVGRIIQASGAGIIMPLMQTIFFAIFPIEKRGAAMGMFGLVIAFAPAIGPTLSGWIVTNHSWRVLFYIVLPIAILDFIFAFFILKNVTKLTYPKLDIFSIILSTIGFGGLLYGFSTAGTKGWGDIEVIVTLAVGAVALILFIIRQLKLQQPILEFRVFKYGTFTLTTAIGMIVFLVMISGATILPLYMQDMLGYSPLKSGVMLLPGAIVMGVLSPITGRIFDKIGARWLALVGLIITTITTFTFTNLSAHTSYTYLATMWAIRMFGIAMVMMPVTTAGLNQLPQKLIPHGTAMNNTMRQVAGSIGTALMFTIMANTALDVKTHGIQGIIHGVNVAFFVAACICIIGIALSFFIKKTRRVAE